MATSSRCHLSPAQGSLRRIRLAKSWPNLSAHCRTASWLMWTAGGCNAFLTPSHANDTDALVWEQSCHDRRLTSRCVPTDGGGAVGKWPAERPSRGERRQATYPQRGSA